MERNDRRTKEEKNSHVYLVIGTDKFMSGWGKAQNGLSYAVWACSTYPDFFKVQDWVKSRSEMRRVRTYIERKGHRYQPGPGCAHLSIYVVKEGHTALQN